MRLILLYLSVILKKGRGILDSTPAGDVALDLRFREGMFALLLGG